MPEPERAVLPALPTAAQVPPELSSLKRWCGWKAVWDEGKKKWRKPPYSPVTGEAIGPTPKWADHWTDFNDAVVGVQRHHLDGVGFVFLDGDGFVGVDFDDCRDANQVNEVVLTWLKWFPTYVEVSPSGTGLHCIGKAKLAKALVGTPLPGAEGTTVEAYAKERYFTFTGQMASESLAICDVQVGLDKLLERLKVGLVEEAPPTRPMSKLTARKLHEQNLEALRHARQGEGNSLLNSTAFFAAKAFAAGAIEGTEVSLKKELFDVVTTVWEQPHDSHGATETINSGWRSGLAEPLVIRDDDYPEVVQTIDEFNQLFYVIENYGGRTRVAWEELSRISKGASFLLVTQSFQDFHNRFMHQLIQVGEKEDGSPLLKSKADVWLRHRYRRQYDKVVFEPNRETPATIRNLWRGFAYKPKPGDCGLYLKHLRENICLDDATRYDYLLGWMAYAVRHPEQQGHVAVVVQGPKGTGKSVFAETFSHLFGQHGLVVSDQARITKNFNAHLRDKIALVCDEAFFAGDRKHEGVLKALITGGTLTIEAKGVDAVTVPNLLHLIIIGNDQWLIPASYEERRFLMLRCGAKQRQNGRYFQAINDQLNHGGYEALLHHLLYEVDLSRFNVREAPHTDELREQMAESLRGVEAAWFECLNTGIIPAKVQKDGTAHLRTDTLVEWARRHQHGWSNVKPQHVAALLGGKQRRGFGFNKLDELSQTSRRRYWEIPPLAVCREVWEKTWFKFEWPGDGGQWDPLESDEVNF